MSRCVTRSTATVRRAVGGGVRGGGGVAVRALGTPSPATCTKETRTPSVREAAPNVVVLQQPLVQVPVPARVQTTTLKQRPVALVVGGAVKAQHSVDATTPFKGMRRRQQQQRRLSSMAASTSTAQRTTTASPTTTTPSWSRLLDETVYKEVNANGETLVVRERKKKTHAREDSETMEKTKNSRTGGGGGNGDQNNNQDKETFYTRAGRAAQVLQEDFPAVFPRAPSMDIYTADVAFVDDITTPGKPNVVHGAEAYQRQLWTLRMHSYVFCSASKMQVLRMWQPQEGTINVRWSVKATPRLIGSIIDKPYYIDGLSEFTLDDEGLIRMHKVTRLDWDRSMFALKTIKNGLNLSGLPTSSAGGPFVPCP